MAPTEPNSDIEGTDYIFLGNIVGRGKYSLETVCLLFTLKLRYPGQIHILRGCHEDLRFNKVYGLADECQNRLSEDPSDPNSVFQKINRVFEYLPLAALVGGKIFCVSSGIGSTAATIEDIARIERPQVINYDSQLKDAKIVAELVMSDPVVVDSTGVGLPTYLANHPRGEPRHAGQDPSVHHRPHQELHVQKWAAVDCTIPRVCHGRHSEYGGDSAVDNLLMH